MAKRAAVTIRGKTSEWADSSAARKPKKRLRELAQWLMWEASAAISVDTKSGELRDCAVEPCAMLFSLVMVGSPVAMIGIKSFNLRANPAHV